MNNEEIVQKFVDEKISMYDFCQKYKLDQDNLIKILQDSGYKYARKGAITTKIINLKLAADEYLSNDTIYIEELCLKYNVSHSLLPKYLKEYLGINIITRHKAKFNDTVFDVIDTEEKAYWLGFMYADGYISSRPLQNEKKKRFSLELSLKLDDISHLNKFGKLLNVQVKTDNYRCRCVFSSQHMWNTLNNYGCTPNKSLTLEFPDESIFKDKSLIRHFIRGYFDGDGCISYANGMHTYLNIQLLGTENFLTSCLKYCPVEFQSLSLRHNHYNENESTMYFNTSHTKAIRFLDFLYKDANIYLDRKFELYFAHINSNINDAESKIGEDCDVNTELTKEIAKGSLVV